MGIEVLPCDAALGAEIRGVGIKGPLSASEVDEIRAAWHKHLVLIIRDQPLTDDQLLAFARNFGELEYSGSQLFRKTYGGDEPVEGGMPPEIAVVSNIVVNGKPIGNLGAGEAVWHTDSSYVEIPTAGSFLHAIEIPPVGGATHFLNMYEAYDALPEELRARVADLRIVHAATHASDGSPRKGYETVTDVSKVPGAHHPVIRTHPDTGMKSLFLGRRLNAYVVGLRIEESEELLDLLWAHTTQERFTYRHEWRVGDLVIWDNRCTMHRRDAFDPSSRRLMHRTQTKGTRPF